MKKVLQLSYEDVFMYEGSEHCIDPDGRHGGGHMVIMALATGERKTVKSMTEVEVTEPEPENQTVIDFTEVEETPTVAPDEVGEVVEDEEPPVDTSDDTDYR